MPIDIPDRWGILAVHRRRFGMKNPVYEQIQARKVKARLHARSHPFSAIEMPRTARYCGLNTYYIARFLP